MSVILITGGSRGIGKAMASSLLKDSHQVAICARNSQQLQHTLAELNPQHNLPLIGLTADITIEAQVRRLVQQVNTHFGPIQVLINNAAIAGPVGPIEDVSLRDWQQTIQTNVIGCVSCCQAVIPQMKEQNTGHIINLSGGGAGWHAIAPQKSAYITSKFAISGFTELLAKELKPYGIRVNAISPGSVDSQLRTELLTDAQLKKEAHLDLGPHYAVRLLHFLLSSKSANLTGKILSARWDNQEDIASRAEELNQNCEFTLRKIDTRNYRIV